MITSEDIDAFAEENSEKTQDEADDEVFDRVIDRVRRGVTEHREMQAREMMPFIRAAARWRATAYYLWTDKIQAGADSMSLGPAKRGQ